jgi:CTP synthase (UTP-ammonia lyase)
MPAPVHSAAPQLIILGEFAPGFPSHLATNAAIEHSCAAANLRIDARWVSTPLIDDALLEQADGLWVAPGSPYLSMEKTLGAIRRARESGLPCLGTCGGFQHIILEQARNVLGFHDAQHAEYDPYASRLIISKLACPLAGREMSLAFEAGSQVAVIYGRTEAEERYYCNFGVAPEVVPLLKRGPLRISGADAEGEIRVVELPGHPFFIGTLFVPQNRSTEAEPHPLVTAFLRAAADHHEKGR